MKLGNRQQEPEIYRRSVPISREVTVDVVQLRAHTNLILTLKNQQGKCGRFFEQVPYVKYDQ